MEAPAGDGAVADAQPSQDELIRDGVPRWGQLLGLLLLLAFVGLSVDSYFGPGLRNRLGLGLGASAAPAAIPTRVYYEPGATARAGQKSTGSEGQERSLLEGDGVLLGATGQLVRLGPDGRSEPLGAPDGAVMTVANLGAWDRTAGRLLGATARAQDGHWLLDEVPLQSVGAALNPPGAPSEALTAGFALGPDADAGRVRRVSDRDGPAVRLRASRKVPLFSLDTQGPLPTLNGVLVSVSAIVRGQPGKTIMLTIKDVIDATGAADMVTDRRPTSEEWTRLTVRRRVVYPSPSDAISVGIVDPDGGDWFEVRDVQIVLGVTP
jgi:hypothetical protein